MANTEGMPDEFVESLMMTPTTTTSSDGGRSSAAERHRRRLQQRMEMPSPQGRPAARIIRASPQSSQQVARDETLLPADTVDEDSSTTNDESISSSIVGTILERNPAMLARPRTKVKTSTSRFAQQQSMNGFPSVHVPLGTFCKGGGKTAKQNNPMTSPVQSISPPTKPATSRHDGITTESLLEASKRDAEGMLQGMTPEEIRQEQQELTKALSPDMIAFLRKRATKGKRNENDGTTTITTTIASNAKMPEKSTISEKRTTKEEKERLAELLSQVKSHQDLDQAYHEVMKEQHPLERGVDSETEKDDFVMACDLLRSTNPRQTLWAARVVYRKLWEDVEQQQKGQTISHHWPLLLPVSLRCLLDQPVQSDTGYLLHTFVLQSLYSLLQLTAHRDHVVDMNPDAQPSAGEVYVNFFMDDAIPSPRLDTAYSSSVIKPLSTSAGDTKDDSAAAPVVAYATESSSTSAQADGEAFERDPMWTLLSKMKLVPRLAQLLSTTSQHFDWPPEAWVSLMGIMAMMAQRSPGAASAMVHHATIIPRIVARILPCLQDSTEQDHSNFVIVYAAFRLFATLARQSRVTAKALPLAELLPPLLARLPCHDLEFRVQQLGLQLWRCVQRYGLGVEALEAMTTTAARHLALPFSHRYALSIEFVSALTQVLELAKFVKLRKAQILKLDEMNSSTLSVLFGTDKYLTATLRAVMIETPEPTTVDDQVSYFRWNTARMRFLTNHKNFSEISDDETGRNSSDGLSMEHFMACLETLDEWTDEGSLVDLAWIQLGKYSTDTEVGLTECPDLHWEASAASFLDAFVQLLLSLSTDPRMSNNRMVQELARSVSKRFLHCILSRLREKVHQEKNNSVVLKGRDVSLARLGWINQSHFAVSKLISHCHVIGETFASEDIHLVRMLAFNLLGRLQRGNESMAAVVLSQDFLFQATGNPLDDDDDDENINPITEFGSTSSPISSMFLGELCGSEQARKQIDHSFKLQHGFGVTKDGLGAFALDSLLSDADQPRVGGGGGAAASSDLTLPLGTIWLWQCLSGQIRTKEEGAVAYGFDEATNVVASVLALLMEMEEMEELMECPGGYTRNIPVGAKLYYLMNICLHTESILREERVLTRAEAVLDRYWPLLDSSASILEFARACALHTDPRKGTDDDLEANDKKLLELFDPDIPNEASLTKEEMRSLEAFLDDMSEAYNDYGAQYDFFTKCMRLFLLPIFPSSIRCRALRDLRGVFHLLSLPTELNNPNELRTLLQLSMSSGVDTSVRDPPEFLNAVTAVLVPNSCPRPLIGFIEAYAIATMTRALGVVLRSGADGLDVMKKRLLQLDAKSIHQIVNALALLSTRSGTKADLIQAVLQSLSEDDCPSPNAGSSTMFLSLAELDEQLKRLRDSV